MLYRVTVRMHDNESDTRGSITRVIEAASSIAAQLILREALKTKAGEIGVVIYDTSGRKLSPEEAARYKRPSADLESFEALFDDEEIRSKRKDSSEEES